MTIAAYFAEPPTPTFVARPEQKSTGKVVKSVDSVESKNSDKDREPVLDENELMFRLLDTMPQD